jgi:N utilization substance protein A
MTTPTDIVRYIDTIARDKEIDREGLFAAVEQAVAMALSKKYGLEDLELELNRESGQWVSNYEISMEDQGRILAQAVKQAIIARVREAERDVLYDEYEQKIGEIVNGSVQRFEGDTVIVNLGRTMEGILPRAEKVRSEIYNVGDRIRAMVLEVKKVGPRLKVILTRTHRDLVRCLFELEVPEIADGVIMVRRIEREPGYRTKLAVDSRDPKVDCVGACVGVRGSRIKSIIDELNGERIDIIRWNADPQILITNALKPAEISHIELDQQSSKALVLVDADQLSLGIGRKGQNVRLASKLTGWDIDIMTRSELEKSIADEDEEAARGDDVSPEVTAPAEVTAPGEATAPAEAPAPGEATASPEATVPPEETQPTEEPVVGLEQPGAEQTQTLDPAVEAVAAPKAQPGSDEINPPPADGETV